MKAIELEQRSPEWLADRLNGVGASESATALGLNPWATRAECWEEKVGLRGPKAENPNMKRGRVLEPEARQLYEDLTGIVSQPVCGVHDDYPFIKVSLDGWNAEKGLVLEIKCPQARNHQKMIEGNVPEINIIQIQHQLAVTGGRACHLVSYCPKYHDKNLIFHMQTIKPDLELQGEIIRGLIEFWGWVTSGTRPPE